MKLSRAAKQVVQSNIVIHVSKKLWKRTKRWNAMIQMNPAKIEIYRSRSRLRLLTEARRTVHKEEITVMARKYGIGPRLFSFSLHEIKVRIDTRYAV